MLTPTRSPEPVTARDQVSPLLEQASTQGWRAGIFDFGKAEAPNIDHFNPGLVERPDGLWLLVRRAMFGDHMKWGQNAIWAFKLNENHIPQFGKKLQFVGAEPREQFEDPRAIFHKNHVWVGCCNFIIYGSHWSGAHQTLGVFDEDWSCRFRYHPEVGGNGPSLRANLRHEKNWPWFFHENRLHLLYQSHPWELIEFGARWEEQTVHRSEGVTWNYGEIRGGTPPVRIENLYWTFFHSSMPWEGAYRRYYMGALAFEASPPFKPVFLSAEPLLVGSANDRWNNRKPPCVFPCGAVLREGKWLVTFGVNDLNCGWVEIPHYDVLRLTPPIICLDKKLSSEEPVRRKRRIKRRGNPE